MSPPCVCGGSNENCRYCGGRGEIGDGLAGALVSHGKHPAKLGDSGKSNVEKKMEADAETRSIERLLSRLKWLRTIRSGAPPTPRNTVPSLVPCPAGCGAQLEPREVNRHLHAKHKRTKTKRTIASDSAKPEKWQSCPLCKAQVKAHRLQRHLRKAHKKNEVGRTNMYKPREPAKVESAKDVLRDSTTLAAPRDKNLDATKLYAHAYREQGRYGSHPSHDGFDDESGPE